MITQPESLPFIAKEFFKIAYFIVAKNKNLMFYYLIIEVFKGDINGSKFQ